MTTGAGVAGDREVPQGLPYHRIHQAGRPGWWRPVLGVLLMLLGFVAIGALVATGVFAIVYAVTGQGTVDVVRLADLEHPTPAGLAFLTAASPRLFPWACFGNGSLPAIPCGGLAPAAPRLRGAIFLPALGAPGFAP